MMRLWGFCLGCNRHLDCLQQFRSDIDARPFRLTQMDDSSLPEPLERVTGPLLAASEELLSEGHGHERIGEQLIEHAKSVAGDAQYMQHGHVLILKCPDSS